MLIVLEFRTPAPNKELRGPKCQSRHPKLGHCYWGVFSAADNAPDTDAILTTWPPSRGGLRAPRQGGHLDLHHPSPLAGSHSLSSINPSESPLGGVWQPSEA